MKTLYKITFDIKLNGKWLSGDNPNSWDSRYVLGNEDVRSAIDKLETDEKRKSYDDDGVDKRIEAVRINSVERVATNILG